MMSFHLTGKALWERMERAVQKIQERLERTAATLEQAGVPYAIIGGNAVRAWVAQADEAAVRTTRDVDIQHHRILRLDALVRMKLTAFRDKDRMHLRDMIDVALVDESWCGRLPPELAARLKEILENPNG